MYTMIIVTTYPNFPEFSQKSERLRNNFLKIKQETYEFPSFERFKEWIEGCILPVPNNFQDGTFDLKDMGSHNLTSNVTMIIRKMD